MLPGGAGSPFFVHHGLSNGLNRGELRLPGRGNFGFLEDACRVVPVTVSTAFASLGFPIAGRRPCGAAPVAAPMEDEFLELAHGLN